MWHLCRATTGNRRTSGSIVGKNPAETQGDYGETIGKTPNAQRLEVGGLVLGRRFVNRRARLFWSGIGGRIVGLIRGAVGISVVMFIIHRIPPR